MEEWECVVHILENMIAVQWTWRSQSQQTFYNIQQNCRNAQISYWIKFHQSSWHDSTIQPERPQGIQTLFPSVWHCFIEFSKWIICILRRNLHYNFRINVIRQLFEIHFECKRGNVVSHIHLATNNNPLKDKQVALLSL